MIYIETFISGVIEGWTNPENWNQFILVFNKYETYILMFISLLIPFNIAHKTNEMKTTYDKYFYTKNLFDSLCMKNQFLKSELGEIIGIIDITYNYTRKIKSRNLKLSNRKRDYSQKQLLVAISKLNTIKEEIDLSHYNNKKIIIVINYVNESIGDLLRDVGNLKDGRLTNTQLSDLRKKVNYITKQVERLDKKIWELDSHVDKLELDLNKKFKKSNTQYDLVKTMPIVIIATIGFYSGVDYSDTVFVFAIYVFAVNEIYKSVFKSVIKHKEY